MHAKGLDSSFDSYTAHLLADYLKRLTVMGIDKCTSQCIILCPHLFERYFDGTLPVLTDLQHVTLSPIPNSFTAIVRTCCTTRLECDIEAALEYDCCLVTAEGNKIVVATPRPTRHIGTTRGGLSRHS